MLAEGQITDSSPARRWRNRGRRKSLRLVDLRAGRRHRACKTTPSASPTVWSVPTLALAIGTALVDLAISTAFCPSSLSITGPASALRRRPSGPVIHDLCGPSQVLSSRAARHMEARRVDTIVFDKTGTLSQVCRTSSRSVTFRKTSFRRDIDWPWPSPPRPICTIRSPRPLRAKAARTGCGNPRLRQDRHTASASVSKGKSTATTSTSAAIASMRQTVSRSNMCAAIAPAIDEHGLLLSLCRRRSASGRADRL